MTKLFSGLCWIFSMAHANAFRTGMFAEQMHRINVPTRLAADWNDENLSSNQWMSSKPEKERDWQDMLQSKQDGSFWSEFTPSQDADSTTKSATTSVMDELDDSDAFLDQLAMLASEEIAFNRKEAGTTPVQCRFLRCPFLS